VKTHDPSTGSFCPAAFQPISIIYWGLKMAFNGETARAKKEFKPLFGLYNW
jgi:hypothetical protein